MADPSCSNALALIKSGASSFVTYYNRAMDHHSDAVTHWGLLEDHLAIEDILSELYDIRQMGSQWGGWDPYSYEGPIWWYLKNCVAEYDLTLVKIIEAYIAADDDHRSAHRLLLDAYQASMYDKPFDQEYHASWIQRFRSWA